MVCGLPRGLVVARSAGGQASRASAWLRARSSTQRRARASFRAHDGGQRLHRPMVGPCNGPIYAQPTTVALTLQGKANAGRQRSGLSHAGVLVLFLRRSTQVQHIIAPNQERT